MLLEFASPQSSSGASEMQGFSTGEEVMSCSVKTPRKVTTRHIEPSIPWTHHWIRCVSFWCYHCRAGMAVLRAA